MNNTLILLIIENIFFVIAFSFWCYRKYKWRKIEKSFPKLKLGRSFKLVKSDKYYVKEKRIVETKTVGVYLMRLYRVKRHLHTKTSSVIFVVNGESKVEIGKRRIDVKPGMWLSVPYGVEHHWVVKKGFEFVEYIEINTPSFAESGYGDIKWLE